jgi:hypothetical protein
LSSDFILAALVLCLELQFERKEDSKWLKTAARMDVSRQLESVLGVLRRARNIWEEVQEFSVEAWKVFRVLATMLEACDGLSTDKIHTSSVGSGDRQMSDDLPEMTPNSCQTRAFQDVSVDLMDFD